MLNVELLAALKEDLEKHGPREVVLKTAGQLLPNSTYEVVYEPSYKYEREHRGQLFNGQRLTQ